MAVALFKRSERRRERQRVTRPEAPEITERHMTVMHAPTDLQIVDLEVPEQQPVADATRNRASLAAEVEVEGAATMISHRVDAVEAEDVAVAPLKSRDSVELLHQHLLWHLRMCLHQHQHLRQHQHQQLISCR